MMLFLLLTSVFLKTEGKRDFHHFLINFSSKNGWNLYENQNSKSNIVSILDFSEDFDFAIEEIKSKKFEVSLGYDPLMRYALSKRSKLNFSELTLIQKHEGKFVFIKPSNQIINFLILMLMFYFILFIFVLFTIKVHTNFPFFMRNSKTKRFLTAKTELPPPEVMKVLENAALNRGICAATEVSIGTEFAEKYHIIPLSKDFHMIVITRLKVNDFNLQTPTPIDIAIVNQDDFPEMQKYEIFVFQSPENNETRIEIPSSLGTLLISRPQESTLFYGDHLYQFNRIYSVHISVLYHLFSGKPSIEHFASCMKEIYERLAYEAIGFFLSVPDDSENDSNHVKPYKKIALFATNETTLGITQKHVDKLIKSPKDTRTVIYNYQGHRVFGYKFEIGGVFYIFHGMISNSLFIVRSSERLVSSWAILIATYFHIYFTTHDDWHALERLNNLFINNPLLSIIELRQHQQLEKKINRSQEQLLRSSYTNNKSNEELLSHFKHNSKIVQSGSIFNHDKYFNSVDEFENIFNQCSRGERSIIHSKDHMIGVIGKKTQSENFNFSTLITPSENNLFISTMLMEDLTYFKNCELKIKKENSYIETASSLLNFHKLKDELTTSSSKLSRELNYNASIYSLLELVFPDDVHILREIKPNNVSIFRLKDSKENPVWYAAVCAESSPTDNSFIGYIFSIEQLSSNKSFDDSTFDDSILSATSNLFALWSIDVETGEVLSSIMHTKLQTSNIEDIYNLVHPNDLNQFKECISKPGNSQSLLSRCQVRMSLDSCTLNSSDLSTSLQNEYIWYEVLVSQINVNKVIILVLNISEQKATLDALLETRQLIDIALYHSNVVQWIFEDTDTPERIFTSGPITYEPLLINWTSIYHNILPEFQEITRNAFSNALNSDEPFEVKVPIFFDSIRWILFRGRRGVKKGQLIGVYFDLTPLKEASDALEKQRQAAEEAASAKSVFLANMSHEIRTPLNGMCGLLEFLQASNVTDEEQIMLNHIQSSFTRLLELLNDTLDLAKIDQNKMQASYTNFSPTEIYEPLYLQTYNQLKNNTTVKIKLEVSPSFPILFYGDAHFMSRILTNLLSNALKYTEKGYILLKLNSDNESNLIIIVNYTGAGNIPDKDQMIFKSFSQLDSSITRPYSDSGIGLTLVSKLVQILNGKLTFHTNPNEGSSFTVELPFEPVYIPFLTNKIRTTKLQILVMFHMEEINTLTMFADFYGFNVITSARDIQSKENLVMVFVQNEETQIKAALHLANPLDNNETGIHLIVVLTSEKTEHDERFEGLILPLTASWMRKYFLSIKFHRKKISRRDPNNLDLHVLVAEDTRTNQIVIERILKKLKCQYKIVDNGQEAIDALDKTNYDLILMDHHMPEVDGPEATRRIRMSGKDYSKIPIIAMTASTATDDKEECLKSGMNTFVSKPVKVAELAQIMMRVTDQTPEQY